MDLATHQRRLLSLISGPAAPDPVDDAYLRRVAASPNLAIVREIALWWRARGLEEYCVLTSRLLKRLGLFDAAIERFYAGAGAFPYVEEQGRRFLDFVGDGHATPSGDPALASLAAAVARFERSLLRVKAGDPNEYTVDWSHEPWHVLRALVANTDVDLNCARGTYRTVTSRRHADLFEVTKAEPLPS